MKYVKTTNLKSLEDVLHELVEVSTFGELMQQPGTPGFESSSILGESVLELGIVVLGSRVGKAQPIRLGLASSPDSPLVVINLDEVAHGWFHGTKR